MRKPSADGKPAKSGNLDVAAKRLRFGAACLLALFSIVAAAHSAALAQDNSIPIPRPSPLIAPGSQAPLDLTTPEATLHAATPELSPGALLDPTNNGTSRLNFNPDTVVNSLSEQSVGVETPMPQGPPIPASATPGMGSNPLLGVAPPTAREVRFHLEARLDSEGPALPAGVTWRIFAALPGPDNKLPLIGEAGGGAVDVRLPPGDYLVHAAYGRAGATKKISVNRGGGSDTIIINGGGLKLSAFVGEDEPLKSGQVGFDVYAPDEDGSDETVLLVSEAPPDQIIGLNAGIYRVISRYGDANAVVRADIRVEAGKLTEATIYQKAARMTLKLVSAHGGEALANTSWTIVTPEGDNVFESVGAFPSVVLSAGDYTAVASHLGHNYERNFAVEAGLDRDVEVIAK